MWLKSRLWFTLAVPLGLCGLLVGVITGGIAYGRGQPAVDSFRQFGIAPCRGQLCFLGISPGVTRWQEARTLASRRDGNVFQSHLILSAEGAEAVVYPNTSNDGDAAVRSIQVKFSGQQRPILTGEIIGRFGVPCAFNLSNSVATNTSWAQLVYPQLTIDIELGLAQRLALDSPIEQVTLAGKNTRLCTGNSNRADWRGFIALDQYGVR